MCVFLFCFVSLWPPFILARLLCFLSAVFFVVCICLSVVFFCFARFMFLSPMAGCGGGVLCVLPDGGATPLF